MVSCTFIYVCDALHHRKSTSPVVNGCRQLEICFFKIILLTLYVQSFLNFFFVTVELAILLTVFSASGNLLFVNWCEI